MDNPTLYQIPDLPKGIKIAHLNINHLSKLLDELKLLMFRRPFDILALSETWLNASYSTEEISISGFDFCRLDRSNPKKGGGCWILYLQ